MMIFINKRGDTTTVNNNNSDNNSDCVMSYLNHELHELVSVGCGQRVRIAKVDLVLTFRRFVVNL